MSNDESGINLDLHEVEVFLRGDKHNFPLSFDVTSFKSNLVLLITSFTNLVLVLKLLLKEVTSKLRWTILQILSLSQNI